MTSKNKLFRVCKILMVFTGVWTQDIPNAGPYLQILYKIYAKTSQLIYNITILFFLVELYKLIKANNIDEAAENLSRTIFVILVSCKLKLCQSKKMVELLQLADKEEENINSSTDSNTIRIYQEHVKYCEIVVYILTISTVNAGSIFIGDGLYNSYVFIKKYSAEERESLDKPFHLPLWYPFDKNKHYALALAHQVMNISQSVIFNCAVQALVNSVMVFIKAEFMILQNQVTNLNLYQNIKDRNNNTEKDPILNTLKDAVKKHQELIRWVKEFNGSIKYLLLLEYCVTSLMLASTLIQIFQGIRRIFNIFFFILCLNQIFILAWNANEILLESSFGMQDAIYNSKWYEQSPKSKILIFFMMMRCRRPLSLSIGPFGPMTVDAAVSRVKLAYTFLSVVSTNN